MTTQNELDKLIDRIAKLEKETEALRSELAGMKSALAIGGDYAINVKGNLGITVGGTLSLVAGRSLVIKPDNLTVEAVKVDAKVERDMSIATKAKLGVVAGTGIDIESKTTMKVKTTMMDIAAAASGTINSGGVLNLNGGSMLNLNGGGVLNLKGGMVKIN